MDFPKNRLRSFYLFSKGRPVKKKNPEPSPAKGSGSRFERKRANVVICNNSSANCNRLFRDPKHDPGKFRQEHKNKTV
ncbi:hypothetical protein CH375_15705 [Leptospira ellisii]|uniref:Uncharacterized protein n=1 Tax=Leptospira ellisii TaxID=2023197 RepID=A0A2N0BEH3_9LEPT|nr:hypothetical protein CH379_00110 [Leptospira ellisii]PKA03656.1 hypothetical protein CH375_15705 [Leptospira ellisii]